MKKRILFTVFILLQLGYFTCGILYHKGKIEKGRKIILKVKPRDPYSPVRGRYLHVTYTISDLPFRLLEGEKRGIQRGEEVFVVLEKKGDVWEARKIVKEKPESGVFIKGKVKYSWQGKIHLEYGIEGIFMDEDRCEKLNALLSSGFRRGQRPSYFYVEVSVDKEGRACPTGIIVKGESYSVMPFH